MDQDEFINNYIKNIFEDLGSVTKHKVEAEVKLEIALAQIEELKKQIPETGEVIDDGEF